MYENVGPRAHVMAAELIEAGVDVAAVNRRLYEDMPAAKLQLLALALGAMQRFDDGELTLVASPARTSSAPKPRRATRRGSSTSCARCRARRSPRSCARSPAASARASTKCPCARPTTTSTCRSSRGRRAGAGTGAQRASRRRSSRRADRLPARGDLRAAARVLRRARGRHGRLSAGLADGERSAAGAAGVLLSTSPPASARTTSSRRQAFVGGRRTGHAGTLDRSRRGCCWCSSGGRRSPRARSWNCRSAMRRSRGSVRLEHGRHRGRDHGDRPRATRCRRRCRPASCASARPRHSAVKVGGERAYRRARRGESFEMPERIVTVHRFEELWRERRGARRPARAGLLRAGFEIECGSGHRLCSPIADLGDAYCVELRRTAIGPFEVRDASRRRRGSAERTPARSQTRP